MSTPFTKCEVEGCGAVVVDLPSHMQAEHGLKTEVRNQRCVYCGDEYERWTPSQDYCSRSCAVRDRQRGGSA